MILLPRRRRNLAHGHAIDALFGEQAQRHLLDLLGSGSAGGIFGLGKLKSDHECNFSLQCWFVKCIIQLT
ncbi:hypothetical protein ACFSUK_35675 [Sphingobium scionense]